MKYPTVPLRLTLILSPSSGGPRPYPSHLQPLQPPLAPMQDVHIGGEHGWVEWLRVHVSQWLALDEVFATTPHAGAGLRHED